MADSTTPLSTASTSAAAQNARAQISQNTNQPTGPNTGPNTGQPKSVIGSDFQTFLEMLTTQMQNQDPLNPIDSSDYAVQLATFSSVEQQVLTNDLLTGLLANVSASGVTQLAALVGMEARSTAPARFDGAPLSLTPEIDRRADAAWLVVTDETGAEVQRHALALTGGTLDWAGVDDTGTPLPAGLYGFTVENFASGKPISDTPVATYSEVIEAQNLNGGTRLVLQGGATVAADEVLALRRPD